MHIYQVCMYRILAYKSIRYCHICLWGAHYVKCEDDHANDFDFLV